MKVVMKFGDENATVHDISTWTQFLAVVKKHLCVQLNYMTPDGEPPYLHMGDCE